MKSWIATWIWFFYILEKISSIIQWIFLNGHIAFCSQLVTFLKLRQRHEDGRKDNLLSVCCSFCIVWCDVISIFQFVSNSYFFWWKRWKFELWHEKDNYKKFIFVSPDNSFLQIFSRVVIQNITIMKQFVCGFCLRLQNH